MISQIKARLQPLEGTMVKSIHHNQESDKALLLRLISKEFRELFSLGDQACLPCQNNPCEVGTA